jgi:uncharacterized membrane protein YjfL (UPF0719 family)
MELKQERSVRSMSDALHLGGTALGIAAALAAAMQLALGLIVHVLWLAI